MIDCRLQLATMLCEVGSGSIATFGTCTSHFRSSPESRHSRAPQYGNTIALLLIQEAAQRVEIDHGNEPIIIADYGSSQGKNSLVPMRATIETLRARFGSDRPIVSIPQIVLRWASFRPRITDVYAGGRTKQAPGQFRESAIRAAQCCSSMLAL
jgi:hypothetical protein